jgi:L-alanine-DL-glutamate epimerase-like enolase superfamily enzyme
MDLEETEKALADGSFKSDIEHIWQLIYRFGFYRGGAVMMSALSGVDIALWDLKGLVDGTCNNEKC